MNEPRYPIASFLRVNIQINSINSCLAFLQWPVPEEDRPFIIFRFFRCKTKHWYEVWEIGKFTSKITRIKRLTITEIFIKRNEWEEKFRFGLSHNNSWIATNEVPILFEKILFWPQNLRFQLSFEVSHQDWKRLLFHIPKTSLRIFAVFFKRHLRTCDFGSFDRDLAFFVFSQFFGAFSKDSFKNAFLTQPS